MYSRINDAGLLPPRHRRTAIIHLTVAVAVPRLPFLHTLPFLGHCAAPLGGKKTTVIENKARV